MSLLGNTSISRNKQMAFGEGFFTNVYDQLAYQDNTPGFPLQFSYGVSQRERSQYDKIALNVFPSATIRQNGYKLPITGESVNLVDIVPDLPFDYKGDVERADNLVGYGLGFVALSSLFLF